MKKIRYSFFLVLLSFLVYLPAFVTEFGAHNDYTLIPPSLGNHLVFMDTRHLILAGRALQAVLVYPIAWTINRVADLVAWRIISFFCMLVFVAIFLRFLRRRFGLEPFWLFVLGLAIVFLPESQLCILMVTTFLGGFVTLLPSLWAYVLLEQGWKTDEKKMLRQKKTRSAGTLAFSFLLFESALFIYPPNAMFVFVCTFASLFFATKTQVPQARRIFGRDLIFFGSAMLVYWIVNLNVVIPWAQANLKFMQTHAAAMTGGLYELDMTADLFSKSRLLWESFLISMAGVWHLAWGPRAGEGLLVLALLCTAGLRQQTRREFDLTVFLQKLLGGVALFVLINLPAIMAKGCDHVIGYRVLFASAVLLLLWLIGLLRAVTAGMGQKQRTAVTAVILIIFVTLPGVLAGHNILTVVRNYSRELNFIRNKISGFDLSKINRVMVMTLPLGSGETLIGRKLPFEFSSMVLGPQHIADEIMQKFGRTKIPVDTDVGKVIFIDENTGIIDLRDAQLVRWSTSKPIVQVRVSAVPGQEVSVFRQGRFLVFKQKKDGCEFHSWSAITSSAGLPWVEFNFLNHDDRVLQNFIWGVFSSTVHCADLVDFILQASVDGRDWVTLKTTKSPAAAELNLWAYQVLNPGAYHRYRFLFLNPPLRVLSVYMDLDIQP